MGSWEASKSVKPREVIAHFSASSLVFAALGLLAFITLGAFMARDMVFGRVDDPIEHGLNIWAFVIIGTGLIILLFHFFKLVRAAVANKGGALWLENGRLTYAYRKLLDVPACEVLSVVVRRDPVYGTLSIWPPRVTWIVFGLRDGTEAKLSANVFAENRDDIVAELQKRLGLAGA